METDSNSKPKALVYKYVTTDVLRLVLGGSIRFTQPSAFNDPFELLPEIVVPSDEEERPISLDFDIRANRRASALEHLAEIPDGCVSSDAISRDIVQQLNQRIGILSLSRSRNSLLMWSHYANQYAGAIIAFNAAHDFLADSIDVEYRDIRPRHHLSGYLSGDPIPVSELCVKSAQWSYEEEVRVVRALGECERTGGVDPRGFPVYVQKLPLTAIDMVLLGERVPVSEQREIFSRLRDTDIALSLAAIDHAHFAFREERIKLAAPISKLGPVISPRTAHIFCELDSKLGEFARAILETHPASKIVNRPV